MSDHTFKLLEDFMRSFAPEVSGRSTGEVNEEMKARIQRMAAGELTDDERAALAKEMLANPDAVEHLAHLLKG